MKYAPGLPAPQRLDVLDLDNPTLAPALRLITESQRRAARAWQLPSGMELTIGRAGETECFVLTPEGVGTGATLLYIHGGAFCLPVQTSALSLAAEYARRLMLRVVLPEYRLLPGYNALAALDDCRRAAEGYGPALIYGESAGAALAAGLARDMEGLKGLLLIYPAADDTADAPGGDEALSRRVVGAMWRHALAGLSETERAEVVPARMQGIARLPRTYIELAEYDCLRAEGEALGAKLAAAGVETETRLMPGAYHGFDSHYAAPYVRRAVMHRCGAMRGMLGG